MIHDIIKTLLQKNILMSKIYSAYINNFKNK